MQHTDPSESRDEDSPSSHIAKSSYVGTRAADASRRSFLIKGTVAVPILAAFVNKPVWAVHSNCMNSGTASGNLSNHLCAAVARSASWWKIASDSLWPTGTSYNSVALSPYTDFYAVFLSNPLKIGQKEGVDTYHEKVRSEPVFIDLDIKRSLRDVLNNGTPVDQELIAAFLNISHPGIAYDGYAEPSPLINAYQLVKNDYLFGVGLKTEQSILNAMFSTFAASLASFNRNYDLSA